MLNMFEKFDDDGNGYLDSRELTNLYNKNGIYLNQQQVGVLHNDPKIKFTLETFHQIPKNQHQARHYR